MFWASVPRLHRWCRPQPSCFSAAGLSFDFCRRHKLSFGRRVLGCRQWNLSRKSRRPTLFELSLKVQGYSAHNRNSGFAVLLLCDNLNAHRIRKVPRGICGGLLRSRAQICGSDQEGSAPRSVAFKKKKSVYGDDADCPDLPAALFSRARP